MNTRVLREKICDIDAQGLNTQMILMVRVIEFVFIHFPIHVLSSVNFYAWLPMRCNPINGHNLILSAAIIFSCVSINCHLLVAGLIDV